MNSVFLLVLQIALALPKAGYCASMDELPSRDFEEALRADNPALLSKRPPPKSDGQGFGAAVTLTSGGYRCRGTKLGPRQFLTAAHCVVNGWGNGDYIMIMGASVFAQYGKIVRISRIQVFPGWEPPILGGVLDGPVRSAPDLALVEANQDTPGIPQAAVAPALPEQDVRLLTFGHDCPLVTFDERNYAYPRLSRAGITSANNMTITMEHLACTGDSGSPLFLENAEIIGVLSSGTAEILASAGYKRMYYTRLDTEPARAWLGRILPR